MWGRVKKGREREQAGAGRRPSWGEEDGKDRWQLIHNNIKQLLVPPKYSVCILRFMDDSPGAGSQTCSGTCSFKRRKVSDSSWGPDGSGEKLPFWGSRESTATRQRWGGGQRAGARGKQFSRLSAISGVMYHAVSQSRALDVSRLIPPREMGDVSYCRIALDFGAGCGSWTRSRCRRRDCVPQRRSCAGRSTRLPRW